MELNSFFTDFLRKIRPTSEEVAEYKDAHTTLRSKLTDDEDLSPIIVSTFLQGSYRRSTAIRPENGKRSDVDVVVVTNLDEATCTPRQAQEKFIAFLENDDEYKTRFSANDRSLRIELEKVEMDLVITSAPSEVEQRILRSQSVTTTDSIEEAPDWRLVGAWKDSQQRRTAWAGDWLARAMTESEWKPNPLRIPDRHLEAWQSTHPLEQIRWTVEHNKACNTHYVNVVKALKWWRRLNFTTPKHPKGYPVEHLIGSFCCEGITSVAQGVTETLEGIAADSYLKSCATFKLSPVLRDRGVPEHDVYARVTGEDFALFFSQIEDAALTARAALDAATPYKSAREWRKLFGALFPEADPDEDSEEGGDRYTPRTGRTAITRTRYG